MNMKRIKLCLAIFVGLALVAGSAFAADKPNIVVIMGDDIGMWNIGAYHRGMMAGRTPNLDKLAKPKACCSPTTTPRRAARRAAPTSSPASCRSAPA